MHKSTFLSGNEDIVSHNMNFLSRRRLHYILIVINTNVEIYTHFSLTTFKISHHAITLSAAFV